MKKFYITQNELTEYGRATEFKSMLASLIGLLEFTGDQLPEVLWKYTEHLTDHLREVEEKTTEYLRSKDKLIIHKLKTNKLSETDYFPF